MRTDYRTGERQQHRHIAVIGSGVAGLSAAWLLGSLVVTLLSLLASRRFWRYALRFYTSASS